MQLVRPAKKPVSPARQAARSSHSPSATLHTHLPSATLDTGLTHVATVSFLASRAAPSLQFFFALGGGIALARAAQQRGARTGYGAALASMLQTVAVMGPARVNAPLTQAITAPMMGRLEARGAHPLTEFLACLALRLVHYTVLLAAFIFVILGGLDEFTGSYETLTGWLGIVPQGAAAALAVTAAGQVCWAIFFSTIQVAAYRRALRDWPATAPPADDALAPPPAQERGSARFDPRAIVIAALLATALLLASTSWALLLCVTAWLIPAWLLCRPDHDAVPLGLLLAALLAFAALSGGLLSGAGLELTLRRVLRAVLLVAVATWMRAAAGPGGLREAFRRALHRLRALPAVREAAAQMEGLDSGPRLVAAARAAADRFSDVPLAPGAAGRRRDRMGRDGVGRLPPGPRWRRDAAAAARAGRPARRAHADAGARAAGGLSGPSACPIAPCARRGWRGMLATVDPDKHEELERERIRPPDPQPDPEREERSPMAQLASDVGNRAFSSTLGRSPLAREAEQGAGIMPDGTVHSDVQSAIDSTRGSGTGLDEGVAERFSGSLGDLSDVRVHTDSTADQLNRSVAARAFATGTDVYFASGEYNPGSPTGDKLIAHELAHVVQQRGSSAGGPLSVSQPGDAMEQEADSVADQIR